jgi:hypothetical protein
LTPASPALDGPRISIRVSDELNESDSDLTWIVGTAASVATRSAAGSGKGLKFEAKLAMPDAPAMATLAPTTISSGHSLVVRGA